VRVEEPWRGHSKIRAPRVVEIAETEAPSAYLRLARRPEEWVLRYARVVDT